MRGKIGERASERETIRIDVKVRSLPGESDSRMLLLFVAGLASVLADERVDVEMRSERRLPDSRGPNHPHIYYSSCVSYAIPATCALALLGRRETASRPAGEAQALLSSGF